MTEASRKMRLACWLGCKLIRALGATWRITWEGLEHEERLVAAGTPLLYAFQHGRLIMATYAYRDYGAGVMVSKHRDGELAHLLGSGFGFVTYRGSTTRGGTQALREMCRVPSSVPLSLTTDGPKGPDGVVAPGVVLLAAKSRRAVLPIAFAARPAKRLASWDRHVLPWPFGRVHVVIEEPIVVPEELAREERRDQVERIRVGLATADRKAWEALAGERTPEVRRYNAVLRSARASR